MNDFMCLNYASAGMTTWRRDNHKWSYIRCHFTARCRSFVLHAHHDKILQGAARQNPHSPLNKDITDAVQPSQFCGQCHPTKWVHNIRSWRMSLLEFLMFFFCVLQFSYHEYWGVPVRCHLLFSDTVPTAGGGLQFQRQRGALTWLHGRPGQ